MTSRDKLTSTVGQVPNPENLVVGNQVAVGPDLSSFQFGREFLRSTSLALLAIYQGITFLLFFMRLVNCFLEQRGIEDRAATEREGILFRGIGWLVIGMKISAIETAIGFASTSFGIVLTRRILRMLGRACIVIGVIKGSVRLRVCVLCSDIVRFRVDRREEFFILDSDKGNEFLSGTRKLKLSAKRYTISSPRLVHSSMAQRMSRMTSLRPSLATFAPPRADSSSMYDAERTPFVSRFSSDLPPDWPTRTSVATTRPRPEPLNLERFSSESHVSVLHSHNAPPTLVLNLSPMDLPSSDIFAAMNRRNENQIRTSTIDVNYVGAAPMPHSAPLQRRLHLPPLITSPPPGIPFGYPESDSSRPSQGRERPRTRSSRRRSLPPTVPPVPFGVSRASAPAPPVSYAWPSVEPERSETLESPQTSAVSPRSRVNESQSTLGCYLIDWIAPEGESRVTRIKSVGAAPRRTTPTPTRAGTVRSSVVLERHETLAGTRSQGRSRREMPRKDSGVLGMDDPALARMSLRPQ